MTWNTRVVLSMSNVVMHRRMRDLDDAANLVSAVGQLPPQYRCEIQAWSGPKIKPSTHITDRARERNREVDCITGSVPKECASCHPVVRLQTAAD